MILVGLAVLLGGIGWASCSREQKLREPIGLFTALPLLWQDGGELGAELRPDKKPHWARQVLDEHGGVVPLDTLDAANGARALAGLHRLVIAQPRVLAPGENVALDNWVRGGGHLLLIIDPAYTRRVGLSDRRPTPPARAGDALPDPHALGAGNAVRCRSTA
jgi:hypothetical protein